MTSKSIETVLAIYGGLFKTLGPQARDLRRCMPKMAVLNNPHGASISTLSILLGIKAHTLAGKAYRAAGPIVFIDWVYDKRIRQLTVSVVNSGRSEITIYDLHLIIMHEVITRSSPSGRYFDSRMELVEEIPKIRWWKDYESSQLPVRLAANSKLPVRVNSKGIGPLPVDIPLNELVLRFVAETPNRYEFDDIAAHSNSVRHFMGLDLDAPVHEP